ncbi:MAG: pantoate--beta-alanine ligase [Acidimicrobiales bacterium]
MKTVTTIAEIRHLLDQARAADLIVGLVPTMGYLHRGHVSLMNRAAAECDYRAATLFVNPLQFGVGEDLTSYPRALDRDTALAESAGIDTLFVPSVEEMYPEPARTTVTVAELTQTLEGRSRPTHFDGVATVVAKLFAIAGPCRAYFGEKDWQQLVVVRRIVADLSFPVEVVGCPTVREPDGLAMSSRNSYLTPEERAVAPVLHRALRAGAEAVERGETDPGAVRRLMAEMIEQEPSANLDYVDVVEGGTLQPIDPLDGEVRLLGAARFGRARLIDNLGATTPAPTD